MDTNLGVAHFLTHLDALGKGVIIVLLALSVSSWYLVLTKAMLNYLAALRAERFLKRFWAARTLPEIGGLLSETPPDNVFSEIARDALDTLPYRRDAKLLGPIAANGFGELLTRTLRNRVEQEASRLEHGLTLVASAGSAAPYIGLFGTVWGIYHALVNIGLSGQGTLDQVSGPVGEALIMTALGLAVAIPAVLAYNGFNRRNRAWIARLDAFAHDLFVMITLGEETGASMANGREKRKAPPALPGSFVNAEV